MSLHVTWRIGSTPSSSSRWAAADGAMAISELWESVRLKASTRPLRLLAFLRMGSRSVPLGGFSSVVTTNFPAPRASANLLMLPPIGLDWSIEARGHEPRAAAIIVYDDVDLKSAFVQRAVPL